MHSSVVISLCVNYSSSSGGCVRFVVASFNVLMDVNQLPFVDWIISQRLYSVLELSAGTCVFKMMGQELMNLSNLHLWQI